MNQDQARGLFIIGNDTGVGKTYVGTLMARSLVRAGYRVGVYKPAASGCRLDAGELISDDALALWEAAGRPRSLAEVCPQRFEAPLAPHLAAEAEGRAIDAQLLRRGLEPWLESADIVLVEGAGGLMSPLGAEEYVATLALDFGFPLVVVARNAIGVINQTLQTLIAAATMGEGLEIAGIVLNQTELRPDDPSVASNRRELAARAGPPVLAEVRYGAGELEPPVDWFSLAGPWRETR